MIPDLYYGQIRPSNYAALVEVFGRCPPWRMADAPHVDLVEAVRDGTNPEHTAFAEYLRLTNRPKMLTERVKVVRELLDGTGPLTADESCGAVLDGNHRVAVALVTGRPLFLTHHAPYQTVIAPAWTVEGRRLPDREAFPLDLAGKVVLDLGAAQGMNALTAVRGGAWRVILADHDFTSTPWRLLREWGCADRCEIIPCDVREMPAREDVDVVLAMSVVHHIGVETLARLAAGKVCLLETHNDHAPPPDTGHRWRFVREVSYSRAEPTRIRRWFVGEP